MIKNSSLKPEKFDKFGDLIKVWIISSLAKKDKKPQEIVNEYKEIYIKKTGKFLIYNHIDKNISKLMRWGIVSLKHENPKTYHLNEGCYNGRLIFKISKRRVLHHFCEQPFQCKCPEREEDSNIREITRECIYWDLLKALEPKFKIRL